MAGPETGSAGIVYGNSPEGGTNASYVLNESLIAIKNGKIVDGVNCLWWWW